MGILLNGSMSSILESYPSKMFWMSCLCPMYSTYISIPLYTISWSKPFSKDDRYLSYIYMFLFCVAPWMRWRRWSGRKCARLFIYEPPIQDLCAGFLPSWRETWRSNFGTFFYLPSYNLSVLLQFKSFIMIHLLHTV